VFHMLKRLLTLNEDDCLTVALAKLPSSPGMLAYEEIIALEEILKILGPFDEVTKQLSEIPM
jgi:hypothetical protein